MTYKLMPETIEAVKRCADQAHQSQSEYVEAAVREKMEADRAPERSGEDYQQEKKPSGESAREFSERLAEIRTVNEQGGREEHPRPGPHHFAKKDRKPRIDPLELLKCLLEKNGLSRKDLAQILGVDEASAARILEGTCSITPAYAARLGELFGVRAALFLSLEFRTAPPLKKS